jgi:hypothetical protein
MLARDLNCLSDADNAKDFSFNGFCGFIDFVNLVCSLCPSFFGLRSVRVRRNVAPGSKLQRIH